MTQSLYPTRDRIEDAIKTARQAGGIPIEIQLNEADWAAFDAEVLAFSGLGISVTPSSSYRDVDLARIEADQMSTLLVVTAGANQGLAI